MTPTPSALSHSPVVLVERPTVLGEPDAGDPLVELQLRVRAHVPDVLRVLRLEAEGAGAG